MAEALLKGVVGRSVFVQSAGVSDGEPDPFAAAVIQELGLDLSRHRPRCFEDLADSSFDLVITLSPEADERAQRMARTISIEVEYWPVSDPSLVEGSREVRLAAYRKLRDELSSRIEKRFGARPTP
jgi:protein-tyrosine-phosphatase